MGSVKGRTAFEIEDIPEAMTAARRWVNWRAVERDRPEHVGIVHGRRRGRER